MKYVISLGGSIIVPDQIDTGFIKDFVKLITGEAKKSHYFFIVTGGGSVARKYQAAVGQISPKVSSADLDLLGIDSTKLNARFLRVAFGGMARKEIITDPTRPIRDFKKINLVSGWKPGATTDHVSVQIAKIYNIKTIINLSDIDYVYDSDPRKNKKAKKIESMTWEDFQRQFSSRHKPGVHVPFDPVAAKLAAKLKLKVAIMNGRNSMNLKKLLTGRSYRGTEIS